MVRLHTMELKLFFVCVCLFDDFTSINLFYSQYTGTGLSGMVLVMKRAVEALKYSALCLPEDISERGLDKVPNFYYRDDGLQVWGALNK